jgi:cleavage stimulation factor subunit 3
MNRLTDAPLRRFASRFVYNGIDEIASRDLGFGVKREAAPLPKRTRPEDSPMRSPRIPEPRFRDRDDRQPLPPVREPPPKRQRGFSPPRRNGRAGPQEDDRRRREFSPPPGPRRDMAPVQQLPVVPPGLERDPSGLPRAVVWFMGNLPRARLFDGKLSSPARKEFQLILLRHSVGPIFKPEDLMDVLGRANIPNAGLGNNMPMGPGPGPGPHGFGGRGRF